jgi:hypothetical protein
MTAGTQLNGSKSLDRVSPHQISTMPSCGPEKEIMERSISVWRARLMRRKDLPPEDFTRDVLPRHTAGFLSVFMSFPSEVNFQ